MASGHTGKTAHALPALHFGLLVKPRRGCSALWRAPPVRGTRLSPLGAEPLGAGSGRSRASLPSSHRPSPGRGSESLPVPGRAEGGPTSFPGWTSFLLPHPGKPQPQGHPCPLAGHAVLSFKSLIPLWLHVKLCQLHKGRVQLVHLRIPWHSAWHVNAYHVPGSALSTSYVLFQVSVPCATCTLVSPSRHEKAEALPG